MCACKTVQKEVNLGCVRFSWTNGPFGKPDKGTLDVPGPGAEKIPGPGGPYKGCVMIASWPPGSLFNKAAANWFKAAGRR